MPKTRRLPTQSLLPPPTVTTASPTHSGDSNASAIWTFLAAWALPIGTLTRAEPLSSDHAEKEAWADLAARARAAWSRDNPA